MLQKHGWLVPHLRRFATVAFYPSSKTSRTVLKEKNPRRKLKSGEAWAAPAAPVSMALMLDHQLPHTCTHSDTHTVTHLTSMNNYLHFTLHGCLQCTNYCMLQLLTAVWLFIVFCDHSTPKCDLQSYIVVALSSPANICACTGWGQMESWIMRLLWRLGQWHVSAQHQVMVQLAHVMYES